MTDLEGSEYNFSATVNTLEIPQKLVLYCVFDDEEDNEEDNHEDGETKMIFFEVDLLFPLLRDIPLYIAYSLYIYIVHMNKALYLQGMIPSERTRHP